VFLLKRYIKSSDDAGKITTDVLLNITDGSLRDSLMNPHAKDYSSFKDPPDSSS